MERHALLHRHRSHSRLALCQEHNDVTRRVLHVRNQLQTITTSILLGHHLPTNKMTTHYLQDNELAILTIKGEVVAVFSGDGRIHFEDNDAQEILTDIYKLKHI